jgi:hypothetical protein
VVAAVVVTVTVAVPLVEAELNVTVGLTIEQLGVWVAVDGVDVVSEQARVAVPT